MRRVLQGKKILVATLGAASVTYAACTKEPPPAAVGNLMAMPPPDASQPVVADPSATAPRPNPRTIVGNLMPMPMPLPDGGPRPQQQ